MVLNKQQIDSIRFDFEYSKLKNSISLSDQELYGRFMGQLDCLTNMEQFLRLFTFGFSGWIHYPNN